MSNNTNRPLSPHLQVYKWHISSLLSISHRIIGIINFIIIVLISSILIFLGTDAQIFKMFSQSLIGKFLIICFCWTFSFQILNEIRHLAWDMGYGFDLKLSKITGILTIIGSFVFTILFYLIGKNLL
jgi:succinate dehydrogenase, cytochrome b556 subunit|tara:strand:- start:67 stop:447 length:381 start_codon:yes stop_codon:yes gene_type:complete